MLKCYTAPNLPSSVVHWRRAPMLTIMGAIYEARQSLRWGRHGARSPQASRSFGSAKSTLHQQARCTCNRSEATDDDAILNSWPCGRTAARAAHVSRQGMHPHRRRGRRRRGSSRRTRRARQCAGSARRSGASPGPRSAFINRKTRRGRSERR